MNSTLIYDLLTTIAATSSSNEKIDILTEHKNTESVKIVLEYAFNPHKRYGVIPDNSWLTRSGNKLFDEETFILLQKLINRDLSGYAARDAILAELSNLEINSAKLLINIIRKDLRAGFGTTITNKIWKDLIPEYSYMRCSLTKAVKLEKFNWEKGVYSQCKLDGMYMNGNMPSSGLELLSRSGSAFPMEPFSDIVESVKHIVDIQTHGEMTVEEDGKILPRKIGNGILNSVLAGGSFKPNQKPVYVVWDCIPLKEAKKKGKYKVPYHERLKLLHELFDTNPTVKVIEYKILHSYKECVLHSLELIKRGEEGTVFKDPDMIWGDGTSKWQVKVKVDFDVDLEIVEIRDGTIGTKNEGLPSSLLCKTSDGLLAVGLTVKNEKMQKNIEKDRGAWIGRIVTVIANDIMYNESDKKEHSLFLPRLDSDKWREDKLIADSFERVVQIHQSVLNGELI